MKRSDRPARRVTARTARKNYKALYRKVERTIGQIERMQDNSEVLSACLRSLVDDFEAELGFVSGRIYEREDDAYVLVAQHGQSKGVPLGYRIPISYEAIQELLRSGLVIMSQGDPGFDVTIEGAIGVSKFAAFSVGRDNGHIVSVTIRGRINEEHILYALSGVRHIINMKLRQRQLHDIIHQAREIQMSMLPREAVEFPGFDIAGESHPADVVGGDLFDYIPQSERLLGLAVADSSGHGLPAALQARDVITGLRMGMSEHLKIIAAIEKLNRVIHRSGLSSRFVSLFYGEIESNGNLIYCNAGHPPAMLLHEGSIQQLCNGGLVLGPDPTARYERGFVHLDPGDSVLIYTDGVTEAQNPREEEFGVARLQEVFKENAGRTSAEVIKAIFEQLDAFKDGAPQVDDRTIVVMRRL